jgi:hypothetical protein
MQHQQSQQLLTARPGLSAAGLAEPQAAGDVMRADTVLTGWPGGDLPGALDKPIAPTLDQVSVTAVACDDSRSQRLLGRNVGYAAAS